MRSIVAWFCAGLVSLFYLFSAVMKFVPVEPGTPAEDMMNRLGLNGMSHGLGVVQLIILVLFLVPRTSTVGFVLLIGYLGGALATNLTHGFTHMEALPIYLCFFFLTVSAYFRNPELLSRVMNKHVPSHA